MPRGKRSAPSSATPPPVGAEQPSPSSPTASSALANSSATPALSSASFAAAQQQAASNSPLLTAPHLPHINQQPTDPQSQPTSQSTPSTKRKRSRPTTTTSSIPPPPPPPPHHPPADDSSDTSYTYPDPADTDTNPLLLPCYLPSLLSSPALFAHVLHHFDSFHLRFAGLAGAIQTTAGTLSAVLHRKYAFKAVGVVKAVREWMSGRDGHIARLVATDIQRRWNSKQQAPQQQQHTTAATDDRREQRTIDWQHPAFGREAVESMLADVHVGGLKYGVLMDFLRHRMSVAKKQRVEDMLVDYIRQLEAGWNQPTTAVKEETAVKREKAADKKKRKEKKGGMKQAAEVAPMQSTSEKPIRANSIRYHNEVALADEEVLDERKDRQRDKDVQLGGTRLSGAEEAENDENNVKEEEESAVGDASDASRTFNKRRGGRSSAAGHSYSLSDEPRWPVRRPFQSPFSQPSWSIRLFTTYSFNAVSYFTSTTAALSFQASGKPVTLQPFTCTSSASSDSSSAPSLLLHAGGSIDAMAWAPVGSPSVCPSTASHYLLVAPSHTKYRTYTPHSGRGVLCLWRVKQQHEAAMVLAIEHDRGDVMDMRWYPHGVWQEEGSCEEEGRLGVLAVGFTDGSVIVLAVPHPLPDDAGMRAVQLSSLPHVVLVPPPLDCRLLLPVPVPTSLAFSPHTSPAYIAIGQSHSAVVVYALSTLNPTSSAPPPAPSFHLTPRLGHQAVRALTFSPANPYHLLLATGQGDVLIIDLRSPFHPIATIPGYASEAINALHCLTSRPSVLLTLSRNRPRLHFLLHEAGDIRAQPLSGLSSLRSGTQRQDTGMCWCVDVLEDEQCGATLAVCGWSDGRVDLIGWRTAGSERDKHSCRIRRLCWLGYTSPDDTGHRRLLTGEGGPSQQLMVKGRASVVELDDEGRVELSGVEMALDEQLAVHSVCVNVNVMFPRQFAVGGLAGIVRIQQVSDM